MEELKSANRTEAVIHSLSSWLNVVGVGFLSALTLLTVADVCGRRFFNHPIKGTFELTELMMVATAVLGLGYTTATRGHVSVDLLVSRFRPHPRWITEGITYALSIVIISLIVWQSTLYAFAALRVGEHSDVLGVPTFYFKLLVPIGSLVLDLELSLEMLTSFRKAATR